MRIAQAPKLVALSLLVLLLAPCIYGQSYTLTTYAGSDRLNDGKQATTAPLRYPYGTTQDTAGNFYIADRDDHRIRKVSATGVITTVAGTGRPGYSGDGGPALLAKLNRPTNVHLDNNGDLLVADYDNLVIRKIDLKTGMITTVVGNGTLRGAREGLLAKEAGLDPYDFAVDSAGNLYVSDLSNHRIWRVDGVTRVLTALAGTGTAGFTGNGSSSVGAAVSFPLGITVDAQRNVYFADWGNNRVRKITAATGVISTVAGNGLYGYTGDNGQALNARLQDPIDVGIEANGDVIVVGYADVRRVTVATGIIRFVTGSFEYGFGGDGGSPSSALWGALSDVNVGPNGDLLLTDPLNFRVRRIRSGTLTTVAGSGIPGNNAEARTTFLNAPAALAINGTGGVWFADRLFHQVRTVDAGRVSKLFADGYPTSHITRTTRPEGIARDAMGNLFVADTGNDRILRYTPQGNSSIMAGGRGYGYDIEFGQATAVKLAAPRAVAVDTDGTLYIADTDNCRVRKVVQGLISLVAGGESCAYSGDDGPAAQATLMPYDLALDGRGGLLVADGLNHRVRRIDLGTGKITTVAGIGTPGLSGDGGAATMAQLNLPTGITVDANGRLFIAEYGSSRVRMVDANGRIRTIAGTGAYESSAEEGPALGVSFDPARLVAAPDGSIYVSDEYNDRIRKLTPAVLSSLQVVEGANGSGEAGAKITVRVKAQEASGIAVAGIPVTFAVTSGTAELSSVATDTSSTGIAQIQVTLGSVLGNVTVTASSPGVAPVNIQLTTTAPVPRVDDAAVVGAGLSLPAVRAMSHGGIMSVFGRNFGAGAAFRPVTAADLVGGKVPTVFAGLCVRVGGTQAPVFGASDTQVNFQVPAGLTGTAQVAVITGCGTSNERATNAIPVPVQSASPEFFYLKYNPDGKNPVAATDSTTGALVGASALFPGANIRPAKPNQYVTIYATGFGDTNPTVPPGEFFAAGASVNGTVRVLLDGQALPQANVLYVGVTPQSPGLYQLNLQLPDNLRAGDLSLVIEIDGMQSPGGAYLTTSP